MTAAQSCAMGDDKTPRAAWYSSINSLMRWASALVWPWLASGSLPPEDSIRMSDQRIPVAIFTDATCEIEMLSSLRLNRRLFTRLTRSGLTTMRVGNHRFPAVKRLAVKV